MQTIIGVLGFPTFLNFFKDIPHIYLNLFCRENETQTKMDGYSNVPKPQVFLAGLRGGGMSEPTVMTKVDLTIDVDQT